MIDFLGLFKAPSVYNMGIVKIVLMAISALIIILLLKKLNNDYAILTSCLINISITLLSFGFLLPVFDYIEKYIAKNDTGRLFEVLFKSTGVCLLCSVASEICKDVGEQSLGSKIELAGKCVLISYALPLIGKVLDYASSFSA